MKTPYFSVIIPTKNRSTLVPNAIQSVLDQTFKDFEIVLVDNDDTAATEQAIRRFSDPRLRVIRSGGLIMPDNWERGFDEARGLYQLVLEDKSVLKARALQTIHKALADNPAEMASWPQELFNDLVDPPEIHRWKGTGKGTLYSSEAILELFMTIPRAYYETKIPRGVNSCVHRDLVARIRKGPYGRICPPSSPDYTMAFLQLAYSDKLLNIDDCLVVYGSCRHSHGRVYLSGEYTAADLKREFGIESESVFFRNIPLKVRIVSAALMDQYLEIRNRVGGRLNAFPMNRKQLYVEAWRDLEVCKSLGNPSKHAIAVWEETLKKEGFFLRRSVLRELKGTPKGFLPRLKAIGRKFGLDRPWRTGKKLLGLHHPPAALTELVRFNTPLEYVRWDASLML